MDQLDACEPIAGPRAHLWETLDRMRWRADPVADRLVDTFVGRWDTVERPDSANGAFVHARRRLSEANVGAIRRLAEITAGWVDNQCIARWQPPVGLAGQFAQAVRGYLDEARVPPPWLDAGKLVLAEQVFAAHGTMTVALLSCASLPETYVIPNVAAVLGITGHLEKHTEYRIRATGATLVPLIVADGLTSPDGEAVAQMLKIRVKHALIRHLLLRGDPANAAEKARRVKSEGQSAVVPPIADLAISGIPHLELVSAGWALGENGLPCNQEEMAYTLLTFSYVSLRSLERMGIGLPTAEAEAYLHLWNVAGHYLGLDHTLMAETTVEAEQLFKAIQQRGRLRRSQRALPDSRAALGQALMTVMERSLAPGLLQPLPAMAIRYLCGSATARDLGLDKRVGQAWYPAFVLAWTSLRFLDSTVSIAWPRFSTLRLLSRVLGYRFLLGLLPPDDASAAKLREQVAAVLQAWNGDPHAPAWMNDLESRLTRELPAVARPDPRQVMASGARARDS